MSHFVFSPDIQITDKNGRATSHFEDIVYELSHVPEGSPASSEAGTKGQMFRDSTYLYICYDTDTWGRIAFTTGY